LEQFGGVVEEVLIDNVKAAVFAASLRDPVLSEPFARFERHYGFLVHSCHPWTPGLKGKVGSGVHYFKRNFVTSEEYIDNANTSHEVPMPEYAPDARLRRRGSACANGGWSTAV
jgi:transposase